MGTEETMTEIRYAAVKMFMDKTVERIERMKRRQKYLILLLVVSLAFNLAFALHYIEEDSVCEKIENMQESMLQMQYDPRSTISSWKAISPMMSQK